jgi:hypothetical protein
MSPSAVYSEQHASRAHLSLERLSLQSWEPEHIKQLQKNVGTKADGWFGPGSIKAWKTWNRSQPTPLDPKEPNLAPNFIPGAVLVKGASFMCPDGVKVVNHLQKNGVPAQLDDTAPRKIEPYQFILHRGAEHRRESENYAQATERVLDGKGCSTTFTLDVDGVIYQHFDPGLRRGRHCSYHNEQSDALDVAGPFTQASSKPLSGQKKLTLKMAIGRRNDKLPPLSRKYGTVKCWTMTLAQRLALKVFIPWYCKLRGIPVTACEDWRTFRLSGGLKSKDPCTKGVKGILAHTNVAGPGSRTDGILPLVHLKEDGAEIEWRLAEDFFNA